MARRSFSPFKALGAAYQALATRAKGRRFVLTLGDEAVVLTLISGRKVEDAWVAPPKPAEGAEDLRQAFATDKRAPVYVVFDTFEQVYREEKLPKVNLFDQPKMVRRHLSMAFPGENINGAIAQGKDPTGAFRFYLIASVPMSKPLQGWMDVVRGLPNPLAALYMLPLESMDLLRSLSPETPGGGVRWQILITNNAAGGLRHIIVKQGRLMLTRLTPAPPEGMPEEEIAAMIGREFRSTLAYVKRLRYTEGDQLDLCVIMDRAVVEHLKTAQWEAQQTLFVTPAEAGAMLKLQNVGEDDQAFCDLLHAVWISSQRKPKLRLTLGGQQAQMDLARLLPRFAPAAAMLATVALLYQAGMTGFELYNTVQSNEDLRLRISDQREVLRDEEARLAALPYSPDQIRGMLALDAELQRNQIHFQETVEGLRNAMAGRVVVTNLNVATRAAAATPAQQRGRQQTQRQQQQAAGSVITLAVRLPDRVVTREDAVRLADEVTDRLEEAFPGDLVELTRPPVAIRAHQVLRGQLAIGEGQAVTQQTYTAEYQITRGS